MVDYKTAIMSDSLQAIANKLTEASLIFGNQPELFLQVWNFHTKNLPFPKMCRIAELLPNYEKKIREELSDIAIKTALVRYNQSQESVNDGVERKCTWADCDSSIPEDVVDLFSAMGNIEKDELHKQALQPFSEQRVQGPTPSESHCSDRNRQPVRKPVRKPARKPQWSTIQRGVPPAGPPDGPPDGPPAGPVANVKRVGTVNKNPKRVGTSTSAEFYWFITVAGFSVESIPNFPDTSWFRSDLEKDLVPVGWKRWNHGDYTYWKSHGKSQYTHRTWQGVSDSELSNPDTWEHFYTKDARFNDDIHKAFDTFDEFLTHVSNAFRVRHV